MTGALRPDRPAEQAFIDAYLFDRLSETDRSAMEDRVFDDEAFAARVLEREDDLVDALAAGTLSSDEAHALSARLQSTAEGGRRLRFAHALRARQVAAPTAVREVAPPAATSRRASWSSLVALALAAGMAWLAVDNVRLRDRLRTVETPAAPAVPEQPAPAATRAAPDQPVVRVVLDPTRSRGTGDMAVVAIPAGSEAVHLVLPGVGVVGAIDVRVESSPGGGLVAQQSRLSTNADGAVDLWVGAIQLSDGDYEVLLTSAGGAESRLVGQYAFRVRRTSTPSP